MISLYTVHLFLIYVSSQMEPIHLILMVRVKFFSRSCLFFSFLVNICDGLNLWHKLSMVYWYLYSLSSGFLLRINYAFLFYVHRVFQTKKNTNRYAPLYFILWFNYYLDFSQLYSVFHCGGLFYMLMFFCCFYVLMNQRNNCLNLITAYWNDET